MEMAVFWVVAPCSLVEVYRRFRDVCCLHHQGDESVNFYETSRCNNQEDIHLQLKIQSVPKRCIHKVNIPYYNVYISFWDTLYC
jgi:hypothetical protein